MSSIRSVLFCISFYFIYSNSIFSQGLQEYEFPRGDVRVMFYNVENLFDIYNDSLINDDEFSPDGVRYWTPERYQKKLYNIAKVIVGIGQWEMPEIIGLGEIENRTVLEDLIKRTALSNFSYRIIHKESPDIRGIDVGFLYRKDRFKPLIYEAIPVQFPFEDNRPTRDILYVEGIIGSTDTLHFFINHWPSRFGGQIESERNREYAASVLRHKVDSLFSVIKNPNIIIMGDLNDYPLNNSVLNILKAKTDFELMNNQELYNLSWYLQEVKGKGSHKYEGNWGILDQIIVSGALLTKTNHIYTTIENAHVFEAPFLLEPDIHYTGFLPFRTYVGYKYQDGYSDHLPVYLDLFFRK
jgi:predicted extracellular nuclease